MASRRLVPGADRRDASQAVSSQERDAGVARDDSTSRCSCRRAACWPRSCSGTSGRGRPTRRNIHNTVTGQWRSRITDAVSIHGRAGPAEAEDRAIPGHWEGDLLLGRHWSQIATVVERSTRFTVLVQLDGRDMATVTEGLSRTMTRLPEQQCERA